MPSDEPQTPKFYLTTPIYYVNARPHIGHAYTTIVADVLARRHRLQGDETFFLTGTDEHGQKIERSAAAAGVPPQQFTDEVSAQFRGLWDRMGLTYDRYIRTTDPAHKQGAQQLFRELYNRGFIYLSTYTGSYCVSDEAFVDLPAGTPCPDCGRTLETVTEENFFFKLSEFQKQLIELIEPRNSGSKPDLDITPDTARNEVLSFLMGSTEVLIAMGPQAFGVETLEGIRQTTLWELAESKDLVRRSREGLPYVVGALRDLSVSRSSFTWGIPVPSDVQEASGTTQNHVIYVWLDALANYMTAIGYGSDDPEKQAELQRYWPADLHLVGKEITRFHCVYWPAFLLAAGLPTPKQITANGWLLFDNAKMSKSRGNVVRTETILDAFGDHVYGKQFPDSTKQERDLFAADVLRYFLLREIPFGQDGSFSFDALVTRYNADLANGYGNLVSRTLKMIATYFDGVVPECSNRLDLADFKPQVLHLSPEEEARRAEEEASYPEPATGVQDDVRNALTYELRQIGYQITQADRYISELQPWKIAKLDNELSRTKLADTLYYAVDSVRYLTGELYPYLPYATARVWSQLGLGDIHEAAKLGKLAKLDENGMTSGTRLNVASLAPIFPRADKGLAQIMIDMEDARNPPSAPASSDPGAAPRTSTSDPVTENATTLTVGGSSAQTPTLPVTPGPHTEAQASGVYAATEIVQPSTPAAAPTEDSPTITIDDFLKVELRVAEILVAERIPKADKLLRLEVDLGTERRQILSGIAQYYSPEELIGRR
ncbi:MAG TPA: class I tRNA ligase family protein, partial [Acidobacteriaceae bacterium]|nr:class I tRNA ligase family protein [Acidobacteriaceae bacterium]